ncbi:MAG TPA: hypothetical protein VL977_07970, partial [Solirubrobacteraceae bacterium]|nr:hypothetical protein [Solirubrobacteraceae bacterium]
RTLYVAHSPKDTQIYRAERFRWSGQPLTRPEVALGHAHGARVVYVSWNGATGVARWQLLAGAAATALAPSGKAVRPAGFETALAAPAGAAYLAVEAIAADGKVLSQSPVTQATTRRAAAPRRRRAG